MRLARPRLHGRSLAARLAWSLSVVMLAAIVLAAAAVAWRSIATIHHFDDSALQDQGRVIARYLRRGPDGQPVLSLPPALDAMFRTSDGDNLYLILDSANRVLAGSDPAQATALQPFAPPPPAQGFFRIPPLPGHLHGMVGLLVDDGFFRIVVAQGNEQRQVLTASLTQELLSSTVWLLVPIGLLTVLIGVFTIRRGLSPLRRASAAAALVGPDRPETRLPTGGLPSELTPLVAAVNGALERLEDGLKAQRRFVGDAAHALRTPLAVLTARLDGLPDSLETEALRRDVDRMSRLVGQMLDMARLEGLPLDVGRRVDLHAVAVEAIGALAPLAIRHGIDLALREEASPAAVAGNHAALVLALTNLIENAIGHAPAGSIVEVEIVPPATLRVLDRGPGVPEADRAGIFARFQRGRGERRQGAGLGLAMVAEIAAAHGGVARVRPREGGGAAFELELRPGALPD